MDDERRDPDEEHAARRRPAAEGVRIIGAEEAAAALEKGEASGRRPGDVPRYGDVPPPPPPSDVRPVQRFPLPDSVDPTSVIAKPAVQQPSPPESPRASDEPSPPRPPVEGGPDEQAELWAPPPMAAADSEPDAPIRVGAGSPDLPHWTEPATGQVPRILARDDDDDDDSSVWSGINTGRQARWRDEHGDWDEADFHDDLGGDDVRVGALDTSRAEHSDLFSFDEQEADPEPAREPQLISSGVGRRGGGGAPPGPGRGRGAPARAPERAAAPVRVGGGTGRNLPVAIGTGVGFAAVALAMFKAGPGWTLLLVSVVVVLAVVEVFDVLRRAGYRPATLLGLAATVSLMLASYSKGERAVPLVFALLIVFSLLWYLAGVVHARPAINVAVTLFAFTWVGFLGSFAALMLKFPDREGIAFLLGAVIATVAHDIGALFFGSQMGRTPLAPAVSPHKTWEGLVGGMLSAVVASTLIVSRIHPWSFGDAFLLGVAVAVVAPIGDLCESLVKRDIGVKDMGGLLPGHGGMLDRVDALLFALPVTYYLVQALSVGQA